jgi:chorismate synthase
MLRYMTSGESHGPQLTTIISGLPSNLPIREDMINLDLARRQGGYGRGGRMKIETDTVKFVSGIRHGLTMGSPVTMVVENRDWRNWTEVMSPAPVENYETRRTITRPRPGHADLPGVQKFDHQDARNILERASARATTTQVAVGALCKALLGGFGIEVFSHVIELCGIHSDTTGLSLSQVRENAENNEMRVGNPAIVAEMKALIDECRDDKNTAGGIFEVIVTGVPAGLGNVMNWDEKLDGKIGQVMMSMQAIKGVEIGMGFDAARRKGSEVHDAIHHSEDSSLFIEGHGASGGFYRKTNRAGGIEGGMTNGEPVVVRAAMKPISTLMRPIASVDFKTKEAYDSSKERSDVCALPAAGVVGEALVAYAVAWAFLNKFGGDAISEVRNNYQNYLKTLDRNY